MHALDLPRRYGTIFVCGSFGIGGQCQQDCDVLRCFYRHLKPGGALVFNDFLAEGTPEEWRKRAEERRRKYPEEWPSYGDRRQASDGSEYTLRGRIVDLDPLEKRETAQIRAGLWREGALIAEEEYSLQSTAYFLEELLSMLEQAGFGDVTAYAGYTDTPATAEDHEVVFIARK